MNPIRAVLERVLRTGELPVDARRLLQRHAVYYAPLLDPPRQRSDPDDPRTLAALVPRRS